MVVQVLCMSLMCKKKFVKINCKFGDNIFFVVCPGGKPYPVSDKKAHNNKLQ